MYLQDVLAKTQGRVPVGSPEIVNLFAYDRKSSGPLMALTQEVMRGTDRPLTFGERELLAAMTSQVNGCMFCFSSHAATAMEFLGEERVAAALTGDTTDRERALSYVLHASRLGVESPARLLTRESLIAMAQKYLTTEEIFQASLVISLFNFFNTFVTVSGVADLSPEEYKASGKMLHDHGYAGF